MAVRHAGHPLPILCDHAALTASVRAALEGVEVTVDEQKNPHHVAPNSKLVMALLDAYHEATDRPRECVATGGGTYARVLEEGVAFGSVFPGEEELAHQADEYMSLDSLVLNMRIFARAIEKLPGLRLPNSNTKRDVFTGLSGRRQTPRIFLERWIHKREDSNRSPRVLH